MIQTKALTVILFTILSAACSSPIPRSNTTESLRVIIVSCAKVQAVGSQKVWENIAKEQPDLLLFVGDIVYLDKRYRSGQSMEAIFTQQWNVPAFKSLIKNTPYFATWDDHDAGTNNIKPASSDTFKKLSYQALYNEAKVSFTKRLYNRDHIENYSSLQVDQLESPNGKITLNKTENFKHSETIDYSFIINGTRFIMLDGISSRSNPIELNANILSPKQFNWLEQQLNSHSGPKVIATGASLELSGQDWGWKKAYPSDYKKLTSLLNKHRNVLVLTGDIHKNATVKPNGKETLFYELVSSGAAASQQRQGNYLIVDIDKTQDNQWQASYHHRGPHMVEGYTKRSGKITLNSAP